MTIAASELLGKAHVTVQWQKSREDWPVFSLPLSEGGDRDSGVWFDGELKPGLVPVPEKWFVDFEQPELAGKLAGASSQARAYVGIEFEGSNARRKEPLLRVDAEEGEQLYVNSSSMIPLPMAYGFRLPRTLPNPQVQLSALPHLTDRIKQLLDKLYDLLAEEARRNFVLVTKTEVSGFSDPEEDSTEIVVTQWVRLPPSSAMEYWDKIGAAVHYWTETLPQGWGRIAIDRIAVEVQWDEPFLSLP